MTPERGVRLEFHGKKVPSKAGLLAYGNFAETFKVVTHSRQVIFRMVEVAVPRELFQAILDRIRRLRPPGAAPG